MFESNNFDDDNLLEPPKYDMLSVKFRGDNHTIVLPYCEVANGDITNISADTVEISVPKEEGNELVKMLFKDFTKLIETTFDIKEITYLAAQLAGTTELIQIL